MIGKESKDAIYRGAKDEQVIRITYKDSKGNISKRNVEPYEIRDGKLWAYCRKRRSIRQFKLANIRRVVVTKWSFFPKWPIQITKNSFEKTARWHVDVWRYHIGNQAFGDYWNAEVE